MLLRADSGSLRSTVSHGPDRCPVCNVLLMKAEKQTCRMCVCTENNMPQICGFCMIFYLFTTNVDGCGLRQRVGHKT